MPKCTLVLPCPHLHCSQMLVLACSQDLTSSLPGQGLLHKQRAVRSAARNTHPRAHHASHSGLMRSLRCRSFAFWAFLALPPAGYTAQRADSAAAAAAVCNGQRRFSGSVKSLWPTGRPCTGFEACNRRRVASCPVPCTPQTACGTEGFCSRSLSPKFCPRDQYVSQGEEGVVEM